jgi:hypothetical protein
MVIGSSTRVLAFAFDTLEVHRLEALVAVANGRGNAALRKFGALPEAVCVVRSCAEAGISTSCSTRSWTATGVGRGRGSGGCLESWFSKRQPAGGKQIATDEDRGFDAVALSCRERIRR